MSNPVEPQKPYEPQDPSQGQPPQQAPSPQGPPPPQAPPQWQPGQWQAGEPGQGQQQNAQPQYNQPQYNQPQYNQPQYNQQPSSQQPPYAQPQYGTAGPYGVPYQPPVRKRRGLWIALGIVGGVVVLAVVGVLVLVNLVGNATGKVRQAADEFTSLLIKGRTDEAYDKYLDPALMQQLGRDEFNNGIQGLELDDSCKPNFSSLNVSSQNGNNAADVAGDLSCTGKTIDLAYRFEGKDQLKMVSIRLRPKS